MLSNVYYVKINQTNNKYSGAILFTNNNITDDDKTIKSLLAHYITVQSIDYDTFNNTMLVSSLPGNEPNNDELLNVKKLFVIDLTGSHDNTQLITPIYNNEQRWDLVNQFVNGFSNGVRKGFKAGYMQAVAGDEFAPMSARELCEFIKPHELINYRILNLSDVMGHLFSERYGYENASHYSLTDYDVIVPVH